MGPWRSSVAIRLSPVFLALAVLAGLAVAPAAGASAARAVVDAKLSDQTTEERVKHLSEIADRLRARYVRFEVQWRLAEPERGVYDEAYLASVQELVDLATTHGLKVVLTFFATPSWASDSSFWADPPSGHRTGYQPFYVPRADAAADFGALVTTVASRLEGKVFAYECWNEPNLWLFFYPQETSAAGGGDDFAVRRYALLLRACHAALAAADPGALVFGGTTSPIGEGTGSTFSALRTSPRRWARVLKDMGMDEYFDAYSHHPYVPGGTKDVRPEARTDYPATTVQLGDIYRLLRVFPDKPFYLTEFGYNTGFSHIFGGKALTQVRQADYLKRAYRFAGRYPQVKALFWYLRRDWSPSGKAGDPRGVYTGLRSVSSTRKRSWFAFAGGMKLTLSARSPIVRGAYTKLTGVLTCSRLSTGSTNGGVSGKTLVVQKRVNGAWRTVKTAKTRSGGRYTAWLRVYRDSRLRVAWRGVVKSRARLVDTR